ncbi:hypothetical protein HER32_09420 [Hymenobacter sp. BT18]|uniref:hypothetical protein n=1 Tax=Hymenobacter sp. BT18 TaxID=2835648 RepID=UPI00143EE1EC|nr:hypothetical protein [Hymenobacter sp. BT18]QIX61384.1 hypothetical protein HER32_09420 [Hymenobacter sp. BT18]
MMFRVIFALLAVLWLAGPLRAQTEYSSPAQQRAANRKALKDAEKQKNQYQDSHLGVTRQSLQAGNSTNQPRKKDGRNKYKYDHEGVPRVLPTAQNMIPKLRPIRRAPKKQPATPAL